MIEIKLCTTNMVKETLRLHYQWFIRHKQKSRPRVIVCTFFTEYVNNKFTYVLFLSFTLPSSKTFHYLLTCEKHDYCSSLLLIFLRGVISSLLSRVFPFPHLNCTSCKLYLFQYLLHVIFSQLPSPSSAFSHPSHLHFLSIILLIHYTSSCLSEHCVRYLMW